MVVPFDIIGKIVDHHCLYFILITLPQFTEDTIFVIISSVIFIPSYFVSYPLCQNSALALNVAT